MTYVAEWMRAAYRRQLEDAARSQSTESIGNRYPWQIREAIGILLSRARAGDEVRIVSGRLAQEFYRPGLVNLLKDCLAQGCTVRVLIWNAGDKTVREAIPDLDREENFELRSALNTVEDVRPFHFLTVGGRAYRLESPHGEFGDVKFNDMSPEIPARICFNDTNTVAALDQYFDGLWSVCAPPEPQGL